MTILGGPIDRLVHLHKPPIGCDLELAQARIYVAAICLWQLQRSPDVGRSASSKGYPRLIIHIK